MSKFSDEIEQEIITRYLSGESTVVLGRAYGTSKTAINRKLPTWDYIACSIQLVERLGTLGLAPRKTKTLTLPNISDIALRDFIRGLWDGDGSWYKSDNALIAHFGCASESFIHALQTITSNITGGSAQVRSNRRKDFWQLSYGWKRAIALARWLYYEPDLPCLERKRAIVQPFL